MNIRILPYRKSQTAQIDDLIIRSMCSLNSNVFTEEEVKELCATQPLSLRSEKEPLCFVATYNGRICGVVMVARVKDTPKMFQISGLFVHPDFALKGVGSQLLKYAENLSVYLGGQSTIVLASKGALEFYTKNGYILTKNDDGSKNWLGSIWCYKPRGKINLSTFDRARFQYYLLILKLRNPKQTIF